MKVAFNDVNIITKARETWLDCASCCFFNKHAVCYNSNLRYHNICNDWHTLDVNIDDVFKL